MTSREVVNVILEMTAYIRSQVGNKEALYETDLTKRAADAAAQLMMDEYGTVQEPGKIEGPLRMYEGRLVPYTPDERIDQLVKRVANVEERCNLFNQASGAYVTSSHRLENRVAELERIVMKGGKN